MRFSLAIVFFFILPSMLLAGEFDYQCRVMQELPLNEKGQLEPYPKPSYLNNIFTIDRNTGAVRGEPFSNHKATSVRILDDASNLGQSFKLLSVTEKPDNVTYAEFIVVNEYSKQVEKPFVGIWLATVYTGLCK